MELPAEAAPEVPLEDFEPFAPEELLEVLRHQFDSSKSQGLSSLPLGVLKHLAPESIGVLTRMFTRLVREAVPPAS